MFLLTVSCTCRWARGHWRSSPCACGAAGNGFLSRTSAGWSSRSSPCEGSPQTCALVHPHPSSWLLSPFPASHPPQSLLQSCRELSAEPGPKIWAQKSLMLWHMRSLLWTCCPWSEPVELVIQKCGNLDVVSRGLIISLLRPQTEPWMFVITDELIGQWDLWIDESEFKRRTTGPKS